MRAGLGIGQGMFVGLLMACTGSNLPARTENARAGLEPDVFCDVRVAAVQPGLCRVFEKRMPRKSADLEYAFHTLRCGQRESICAQEVSCDCTQPLPAHSCEPERAEHWPYEEGRVYTSQELTRRENQFPDPTKSRLGPKLLEFEKGDCEGTASVHPPEYGRCSVVLESTPERLLPLHVFRSLALGETLEICGIPVTCECEGYPPAGGEE